MQQQNRLKSISQPLVRKRVDFFYIKPLQKQQQEVQEPQILSNQPKNDMLSFISNIQDQKSLFNSSNNITNYQTRSDNFSIQSSSLQLPKTKRKYLDDYLFISNIGRGAYGRVYKLKQKENNSIYAGKMLLKSYNSQTNKYKNKKLQSQIRIHQKLSHSNISELHQIYTWKNQYTLIMQYVNGDSLKQLLQTHPNDQKKVARIVYQILDVLQYLHSLNVVHHDLKPENIVYDPISQIAKILDFGEAIQMQSQVQTIKNQGGTYAYFAPEYFQNQCSGKLDVWACGIILFYLLDAKTYFYHSSRQKMKQQILSKQVKFEGYNWSHRTNDVKDLILQMLQKDPSKRISAAQAKQHKWIVDKCKGWVNPAKNIIKNSIKQNKKTFSLQKQSCQCIIQKRISYNIPLLNTINSKKMSRFSQI